MEIKCAVQTCLYESEGYCTRVLSLTINEQGVCKTFHSFQGEEKNEYLKQRKEEENGSEEYNSEMHSEPSVSV